MTTLTDRKAAAHAKYIADALAPEKVRHGALSCLVSRIPSELLRTGLVAACGDLAPVWLAWADEVDLLAAHGFTGSTPREAAKIALVMGDATAADYRNPKAYRDIPEIRHWVRTVADEMDELLAEGFDPEVYAKEIDQALGGAR